MLAGCGGGGEKDGGRVAGTHLTIYSSMPLEGPDRTVAIDVVRAERLALHESGSAVGRYQVDLDSLDAATPKADDSDPGQIARNAHLATKDLSTIAYIGELQSGTSAISIPPLNQAGILEVSPLDTAMELTTSTGAIPGSPLKFYPNLKEAGRTFARVVPNDRVQGRAVVDYMRQDGVRRLAILTDDDTNAMPLAGVVRADAKAAGITVLKSEDEVDPTAEDQHKAAAKVLAGGPDAVFYNGSNQLGAERMWQSLAAQDPSLQLYAPDVVADQPFLDAIGQAARDATHVTRPALAFADYPDAAVRFESAFRKAYGYAPVPEALYGYEAMRTVLAAIRSGEQAAGDRTLTRADVVRAYFQTRAPDSVLGSYDIEPSGDTTLHEFGAYRAEGKTLTFVKPLDVTPAD